MLALVAVAILVSPLRAAGDEKAQAPPELATSRYTDTGTRLLGFWGGLSPDSPGGHFLGQITDREFFLAAVRVGWVLGTVGPVATDYTVDLIPLAIVTNNPVSATKQEYFNGVVVSETTEYGTVYGFGVAPLGLRLRVPASRHLQVFANGSLGLLFFSGEVPTLESRRLNFTFDFGGGVDIPLHNRRIITVGYKFHHLSNGNTAFDNPGLDANLFYFGLSWVR